MLVFHIISKLSRKIHKYSCIEEHGVVDRDLHDLLVIGNNLARSYQYYHKSSTMMKEETS